MTEQDLKICQQHKCVPHVHKQRHGLWVAYCTEPQCEITGVYEEREEAMAAWNSMMDRIKDNE